MTSDFSICSHPHGEVCCLSNPTSWVNMFHNHWMINPVYLSLIAPSEPLVFSVCNLRVNPTRRRHAAAPLSSDTSPFSVLHRMILQTWRREVRIHLSHSHRATQHLPWAEGPDGPQRAPPTPATHNDDTHSGRRRATVGFSCCGRNPSCTGNVLLIKEMQAH